jgi:hypothetical protein
MAGLLATLLCAPALAEESELSTEEWREPDPPDELGWELLRLPELAARLALSPLLPLLAFAEEERLDRRVIDLLTNDERTLLVLPVVALLGRDGLGAGFRVTHSDLLGGGEQLEVDGRLYSNLDRRIAGRFEERVWKLGGRAWRVELDYELDANDRWFGRGGDTRAADERALSVEQGRGLLAMELWRAHSRSLGGALVGELRGGVLRQAIGAGEDGAVEPVAVGEGPAPPPGFDRSVDFGLLGGSVGFDARDNPGPTSRGLLLWLDLDAHRDLEDAGLGAVVTRGRAATFLPLGSDARVLALIAGASRVVALGPDEEPPLATLATLGRTTYLRGYTKHRFRDVLGWWGTLEYRYAVAEYEERGIGLAATLFADVGRVAPSFERAFDDPIRHSYGLGVRAHTSHAFVLRAQVGFSPEGTELTFSLNEHL